jgi:hypothetical protein
MTSIKPRGSSSDHPLHALYPLIPSSTPLILSSPTAVSRTSHQPPSRHHRPQPCPWELPATVDTNLAAVHYQKGTDKTRQTRPSLPLTCPMCVTLPNQQMAVILCPAYCSFCDGLVGGAWVSPTRVHRASSMSRPNGFMVALVHFADSLRAMA